MSFWRGAGLAGAWSAATGLGAMVVWVGLHPVLDAAVPDRTSALSAASVRQMATPSSMPVPVPSLPSALPSATAGPPTAGAPGSPRGRSPAPSASRSLPPAAGSSPVVVGGWTVTTKPDGTPTYTRSFHLTGGDAVIGMTPGHVYLISATPRSHYTVQTSQPSDIRLVVQFINGNLANLIDAIWWNDAPYAQVT